MSPIPPSLDALKTQAKALRKSLADQGHAVSHGQSLELLAKQMGHRDWNTLHASAGNRPPAPFQLGQRIAGRYLGCAIAGEVIGLRSIGDGARFDLTLRFDHAVDVIPFDGLSNLRKQVRLTVDRHGRTFDKTSDGAPHLQLEMA